MQRCMDVLHCVWMCIDEDAISVPIGFTRPMEQSQEKVVAKLRIAPELHRALRIMAADRHMTISALASEIFSLAVSQTTRPIAQPNGANHCGAMA